MRPRRLSQARPGEIAPHAILRCVEAACAGPSFPDGVLVEQREFQQLVASPESAALRHIFFAERAGKRVDGLPASVTPQPIRSVGIVGAGLMGGGIAMCCANVGIDVVLMDLDAKGLDRGMKLIAQAYKRSRSMAEEAKAAAMARIRPTTSYADFADVDMAVEAIFESMPAKVECFEALDAACKPGAFLCSNTSFLNIDTMAAACRPERQPLVMGAHFFSPANVMKLLENVRGARTSDVAIATMMDWGSRIGKWTILAGNCHGFIGNRMISFYTDAARAAVAEGAMPGDVDRCATAFGMRMGPLAMGDLVGLDVGIQAIKAAGEYDPKTNITHALLEAGRKGRKTGSGWFDYDQKGHGAPSPFVTDLLSKMYPPVPGKAPPTDEQITLSLFMPMINEGFKILEEGFAQRPSDIDTCFVHGYSFPRVKGGPMHWADAVGLDRVKSTLEELGIAPAALLIECVEKDVSLGTYWAKHGSEVQAKARERAATSRL